MMKSRTRVRGTVRELAAEVETEVTRLIAYVNDAVVPEARRVCSRELRAAAGQLGRMAAQLDRGGAGTVENPAAGGTSGGR